MVFQRVAAILRHHGWIEVRSTRHLHEFAHTEFVQSVLIPDCRLAPLSPTVLRYLERTTGLSFRG